MKHWKVFLKNKVIYQGGTKLDCLRWLRDTYQGVTLKEILDDGIRIKT